MRELFVRRRLLRALSLTPLPGRRLLTGATGLAVPLAVTAPAALLAATPSCDPQSRATPRQTEGPYFTRNSPQRASLLEAGVDGTRLILAGRVLGLDCAPLPGVLLDFWQADAEGRYDNRQYRLRGHQFTDAQGRYRLETVVPGLYPGRTRHIHVKVQAPKGPVLTTQLYFADEPNNRNDPIFSPDLVMSAADSAAGAVAAERRGGAKAVGSYGPVEAGFEFAIRTA